MKHSQPLTLQVALASAYVTNGETHTWMSTENLNLDRASALTKGVYVRTAATAWECTRWQPEIRECAWTVNVVALIWAEAAEALQEALLKLSDDVAAGLVLRGTHDAPVERDPLGWAEAQLETFWKAKYAELQQM